MKSSAAHLFRLLPQLTALLSLSSVTKPTIGVPYRLTKTARQVKGLPEGATLGQIGSSDDGTEVQVITTAEWIRRSLDRASLVVAI